MGRCRGCGVALVKKPGPGRWPVWCEGCRRPPVDWSRRACQVCGTDFTPERAWQKFCSQRCRRANYSPNDAQRDHKRKHERSKYAPRSSVWFTECRYCDKLFCARAANATVCYAADCQRRKNNDRQREFFRSKGGNPWRTWHTRTCIQCGKQWQAQYKHAKYCSNACQAAYEHGPDRALKAARIKLTRRERRWLKAQRKLDRAAQGRHRRWKTPVAEGICVICGKHCMGWWVEETNLWCCDQECRIKAKARQQCEIKQAVRLYVFTRDKWTCHLCHKSIDPDLIFPHALSAVVDHILPRAHGGSNKPDNLKAAHNQCNYYRQDSPLDAWLVALSFTGDDMAAASRLMCKARLTTAA